MNTVTSAHDPFQDRYLAHQKRKKEVLLEIMRERHSERMFSDEDVPMQLVEELVEAGTLAPSSCDRRGVEIEIISDRDRKELLGGVLVGGVGWVHRAKHVLTFFGDPLAYKAGDEVDRNPYLDTGVMVQNIGLLATASGLSGCFINPSVREVNRDHFQNVFGNGVFCGAYALGMPQV